MYGLNKLFSEGRTEAVNVTQAVAIANKAEKRGYRCHVDQPLTMNYRAQETSLTYLPTVELCQGSHCHCRY